MTDDDFELDIQPTSPSAPISIPKSFGTELAGNTEIEIAANRSRLESSETIPVSQEATRAKIAWVFTQIFLLLVTTALILPTIISIGFPGTFDTPVATTKELVTLIASVLAGPFGFIVGFYFKEREG